MSVYYDIEDAIESGDTRSALTLLTHHMGEFSQEDKDDLLRAAACHDRVAVMELLVKNGANIHVTHGSGDPPAPEGIIADAAGEGALNAVRWLVEHGAKVNYEVQGTTRCFTLVAAVNGGHLDVVKYLVEEAGADINAVWIDMNPLSHAIMFNQKEIEAYLRSRGAKEPKELGIQSKVDVPALFREHLSEHLGEPEPLSLQEVVPGDPPLTIHAVRMKDRLALVTEGMSSKPMTVPPGQEEYQYAELVIYLPKDWPLTKKALADPNHFWPIEWLRRIARYPHENDTWLGGPATVFANDEPPQPLAPNTQLTCLLAITEESEFGCLHLPDGRQIAFYTLFPLYTEERDLEKKQGTAHLLQLFQKHKIGTLVSVKRKNVALAERGGLKK